MKKFLLLAALIGGVSFASEANNTFFISNQNILTKGATIVDDATIFKPNTWVQYWVSGFSCVPGRFITVDDADVEDSVALIGLAVDQQLAAIAGC